MITPIISLAVGAWSAALSGMWKTLIRSRISSTSTCLMLGKLKKHIYILLAYWSLLEVSHNVYNYAYIYRYKYKCLYAYVNIYIYM